MAISAQDVKRVKGLGFLRNRGTDEFSGRIITENGVLTAQQMQCLSEAARVYGNGKLAFTSRLTIELPGIPYENIEPFIECVEQGGMVTGGTGSKVRPVVACKGTTCVYGLIDTQELASEIHRRFYEGYHEVALPHKFKIAVGGCPNNCVKPDLNDLGIIGQRVPTIDADSCKNCSRCGVIEECPMSAVQRSESGVSIDRNTCNNCGRCAGSCTFDALSVSQTRYKVYVGGRWGKKIRIGSSLTQLFSREEALDVVEKAILLFKSEGISGERFGETVERLGVEAVEAKLTSQSLLARKEEILGLLTVGGATC